MSGNANYCSQCRRDFVNGGTLAMHMKTHDGEAESPSLLRYVKRIPAKKMSIELKPLSRKPTQTRISAVKRSSSKPIPSVLSDSVSTICERLSAPTSAPTPSEAPKALFRSQSLRCPVRVNFSRPRQAITRVPSCVCATLSKTKGGRISYA